MAKPHTMADNKRKHRSAVQAGTINAVRYCKECGRGQLPSKYDLGNGRTGWTCRYCRHEHS